MKVQSTSVRAIATMFLFAAALFAQQVTTDYDRATDFSQYRTYSWENVHTQDALWVDRIKAAVNSALAAKGWTPLESGGRVSVMAMEITQSHQTLNTYYDNFGGGWRWGGGFGDATTTETTYKVGTLVVDLFDSKTKKLIWRGSSSDVLSSKSDKNIKELNKGVQKMFDRFPPDTHRADATPNYAQTVLEANVSAISAHSARLGEAASPDAIRPFQINIPEEALVDVG